MSATPTFTPTATPTPIGCTMDSQCDDGNQCTNNTCNTLSGGCLLTAVPDGTNCTLVINNTCAYLPTCFDGVCTPLLNNTACDDNNMCTLDICTPTGCTYIETNDFCDDGLICTEFDSCSNATCEGIPNDSLCEDNNKCTLNTCSSTIDCVTTPLTGTPCDNGDACTDDICNAGTCISTPISPADNFTCTVDTCNSILGIINTPDDSLCTGPGEPCIEYLCDPTHPSADPVTGCYSAPAPVNTTCVDTFNCTINESCDGAGTCVGQTVDAFCQNPNQCVVSQCIPMMGCQETALTGFDCDDGLACTVNDICSNMGICQGTPDNIFCSDDNDCTLDLCLLDDDHGYMSMRDSFGCLNEDVIDNTPCTDENPCTMGDLCQSGVCVPGPLDPRVNTTCPTDDLGGWLPPCQLGIWECNVITGNVFCANATLPKAENCGDGIDNNCNGLIDELCDTVTCNTTSMIPQCNTTDQCMIGTCIGNTTIGVCEYTINVNATCNTGDPCMINGVCQIDGFCLGEPLCPLSNNTCEVLYCNATTASCESIFTNSICDNEDNCTDTAICIGGTCQELTEIYCDDGNVCTINDCTNGTCTTTNVPDGSVPCSTGNLCTTNNRCVNGTCISDPVRCEDNPPCVIAECNILTGQCDVTNTTLSCDDGNLCTENDTCDGFGQCMGVAFEYQNNNTCISPRCFPDVGYVEFFNNVECDDGNECSSQSYCNEGLCDGVNDIECDDDDEDFCRDTVCDPILGCIYIFNMNDCNDFISCTIDDRCDGAGNCTGTVDHDLCNTFDSCSIGFCNTDIGNGTLGCQTIPLPDGTPCSTDNLCITDQVCRSGVCSSGTQFNCSSLVDDKCLTSECSSVSGCIFSQKCKQSEVCNSTTGECSEIDFSNYVDTYEVAEYNYFFFNFSSVDTSIDEWWQITITILSSLSLLSLLVLLSFLVYYYYIRRRRRI